MADEVQATDVFVARRLVAAAGVRVAAALVLVALDRVRLDRCAHLGDHLLGEAAVRCCERLPLAMRRVDRLGERDALHAARGAVGRDEVGDLRLQRDLEWVLADGRLVFPGGGWSTVELDRPAQGGRRCLRDPNGECADPIPLCELEVVARGEAPRAVHEDADAEAVRLAHRDALDAAALDRDRLVPAADHAYVRVRGAELRGGVQGAVGQVSHVRGRERTRGPDQRVLSLGEAAPEAMPTLPA